ncbi:MAG: DUF1015 domain-containing protein [Clostridia bacterium]|nr:DUF1015 domain-containing protein [Clostridia bacterium]
MYETIGVKIPQMLLPAQGKTELEKWAVVACDQFTSQPEYWQKLDGQIGEVPSTLRLILPEAFLQDEPQQRIAAIHQTMKEYLADGVFDAPFCGFMLVERSTDTMPSHKGIVLAVDLEAYEYAPGNHALIRASEATVAERLPARIRIRDGAELELPHVMLLMDDPEKTVIEPLFARRDELEKAYDFELNAGGGRLRGWKIADPAPVCRALEALLEPRTLMAKYDSFDRLLFAVGDGNHTLASAKAYWEQVKATLPEDKRADHPARYALTEICNLYDEGIAFEPIHRLVCGAELNEFLAVVKAVYGDDAFVRPAGTSFVPKGHCVTLCAPEGKYTLEIRNPHSVIEIGTIQQLLDAFLEKKQGAELDYIHGREALEELSAVKGRFGILLPPLNKYGIFKSILKDGVFPRKAFSIGEAFEKRYYMEARRITE